MTTSIQPKRHDELKSSQNKQPLAIPDCAGGGGGVTMRTHNTKGWPIMPAKCRTCPFGEHGDPHLAAAVLDRTLFQSSQICHHPALDGEPETHLCRGQRDHQLQLLYHMGLIDEATDEAFTRKSKALGVV